jgi:hypothetical protein
VQAYWVQRRGNYSKEHDLPNSVRARIFDCDRSRFHEGSEQECDGNWVETKHIWRIHARCYYSYVLCISFIQDETRQGWPRDERTLSMWTHQQQCYAFISAASELWLMFKYRPTRSQFWIWWNRKTLWFSKADIWLIIWKRVIPCGFFDDIYSLDWLNTKKNCCLKPQSVSSEWTSLLGAV